MRRLWYKPNRAGCGIIQRIFQDPPICLFTHFSSPPDAMISCTLGGSAPTFWLQVGPFSPSSTVTVDRRRSQVNLLIKNQSSFLVSGGNIPKRCLGSQFWLLIGKESLQYYVPASPSSQLLLFLRGALGRGRRWIQRLAICWGLQYIFLLWVNCSWGESFSQFLHKSWNLNHQKTVINSVAAEDISKAA